MTQLGIDAPSQGPLANNLPIRPFFIEKMHRSSAYLLEVDFLKLFKDPNDFHIIDCYRDGK